MSSALSRSVWSDAISGGTAPASYARLWGDRTVDVAVVGGGITGLVTALLVAREGLSVALLEARRLGSGTTGRTTAHLTAYLDARFDKLVPAFGRDGAKAAWDAGAFAIDLLEILAREEGFDPDFQRTSGYFFAEDEKDASYVDKEADYAKDLNIPSERVPSTPLPFPVHAALHFPMQARVHAGKLVQGLAAACARYRVQIFEDSRVLHLEDGPPCTVTTEHGQIRAGTVVLATHSPIGLVLSVQARLEPYMSYAMAFELKGAPPEGLFWNTRSPYDYVRPQGDLLIVGGRDHKTGHGEDLRVHWDELEAYTRERFPVTKPVARWSADLFEPADGLPYIGRVPGTRHMLMATGFAGNGMTLGPTAARICADIALGRQHPWEKVFHPTRGKPVASIKRVLAENVDTAFHFVADRLSPGDVERLDQVPAGEGRIVRLGGTKMAAWRADDGKLHVMSAICTHAGCIVHWNDAERTWDCPCHGGRYACTGEVIDGPPVRALNSPSRAAPVYGPVPPPEDDRESEAEEVVERPEPPGPSAK